MRRFLSVLTLCACAAAPAFAQEDGRPEDGETPEQPPSFDLFGKPSYLTIGAGVIVLPTYEGAADYDLNPLPVVDFRWGDRLFFNTRRGVGVNVYTDDNLKLSAALGYAFGRDEDDDGGLRGMGDIDPSAKPNVELAYDIAHGIFFDLKGFAEVGDGARFAGSFGTGWKYQTPLGFRFSVRAGLGFADPNYMEDYFGVSSAQAARSGYNQFDAQAGLYKTTLDVNVSQQLSQHWGVFGLAGMDYLLLDAASSPINKRRAQFRVGAGVTYTF